MDICNPIKKVSKFKKRDTSLKTIISKVEHQNNVARYKKNFSEASRKVIIPKSEYREYSILK